MCKRPEQTPKQERYIDVKSIGHFPQVGKNSLHLQLKRGKFVLVHGFQRTHSIVVSSKTERAWQEDMAEESCLSYGSQETENRRAESKEKNVFFQAMHPVTHLSKTRLQHLTPHKLLNSSMDQSTDECCILWSNHLPSTWILREIF